MQVMSCGCRYDSDVNIADRWNGTPLMAALRNGHLAIAKMLMSCEATLGDNADPALVQVSNNSACFLLLHVSVIHVELNQSEDACQVVDVHQRVETQFTTGNLLQYRL